MLKAALEYTLYIGGVENDGEVTVSVADPTVVSYEGGTITALKEGTTTLTLTHGEITATGRSGCRQRNALYAGFGQKQLYDKQYG